MQSEYFLVFKDIRSDAIEKHLVVSLWLETSILSFKRFTTAIRSPIVACLSPIALVTRIVVTSFSCYDLKWRNCENPTVLLFHGWLCNWRSGESAICWDSTCLGFLLHLTSQQYQGVVCVRTAPALTRLLQDSSSFGLIILVSSSA